MFVAKNTLAYYEKEIITQKSFQFWGLAYKNFTVVIYRFRNKLECLSLASLSSLVFVGEARSLPQSGAPERSITRVGSSLTHKHQTRLERLDRDKPFSTFRKSVNYSSKKFYRTVTLPQVVSSKLIQTSVFHSAKERVDVLKFRRSP